MPLFEVDCSDIAGIIETSLKVEHSLKTISAMFLNERYLRKVNYSPYFQRNYVWDSNKASYFIESILLGTDIPPLVLFSDGNALEVIDGRQRFETILRFVQGNFSLSKDGLHTLNGLVGKKYSEVETEIRDKFDDSKLRILQFSVVNEPSLTPQQKDKIKKEIFSRYNSGIIPLKQVEIERAEYNNNSISRYFEEKLENDQLFSRLENIFIAPRARKKKRRDGINVLLSHIRTLLTMPYIPIRSFAYGKNKPKIVQAFFEANYKSGSEKTAYDDFIKCVYAIESLVTQLRKFKSELSENLLLRQVFFWAFYLLEKEYSRLDELDLTELAALIAESDSRQKLWIGVPDDYQTLEKVFSQTGSHYDKAIISRYTFAANCCNSIAGIAFEKHLKDAEKFRSVFDGKESVRQFEKYRISKADPHSESVYDILNSIHKGRFEIRPPYQRSEATDSKKASYLIESIMLDIKIPPIFVCKRKDGVSEVIDGQQRLLSIIGFLGESYYDENGIEAHSDKDHFKLKGLRILDKFNGMNCDDINEKSPEIIEKILDFNIEVIEIDMETNPEFSALDLFLRLNQKPFPIKPNSFELWNSYLDRSVITKAKEIVALHPGALFKTDDTRMQNEELVMMLGFVAYNAIAYNKTSLDVFDVFVRDGKMSARIRSKSKVTEVLDDASRNDLERMIKSLQDVDVFLTKLENLSGKGFVNLRSLFTNSKGQIRVTNKNVYLLWILLSQISADSISRNATAIMDTLKQFFDWSQDLSQDIRIEEELSAWADRISNSIARNRGSI